MRKRRLLLVAGACLATLSLGVGTALADPTPAQPPFRALQGVGSDTTQEVLNAYANGTSATIPAFPGIKDAGGNLVVASWDAVGSATITTKDPATFPQCSNIPRPNGSGDGLNALAGLKAGFPAECADFTRSSTDDHTARAGQGLTYIPFATDEVTYATLSQSNVAKNFTQAQLRTIFQRDTNCGTLKPRVPQVNSGTRNFWRTLFGFPVDATHPTGFGACVQTPENNTGGAVAGNIVPGCLEEHNGCLVNSTGPGGAGSVPDPNVLIPYGVGPWTAQTTNRLVNDVHGNAILRGIDGLPPFAAGFPVSRPLFNVIKTSNIGVQPWASTFVGSGSAVCSNTQVLAAYGFETNPNCGSTTIQTP
ncbi:MAG TPA: substrate-binding domain-containing protein [Pseudonocardiaceae bacterium]|nr:substrate-binding domain-containing protein [Pseudonocardiaceae bacterium]